MSKSPDKSNLKPRQVNTFIEACNLFEQDLKELLSIKLSQKKKISEKRTEAISRKEKKVINRIKTTNKEILERVGEFLMQKNAVEVAVYLHKLIEESKK
jgi:hypothetical protein